MVIFKLIHQKLKYRGIGVLRLTPETEDAARPQVLILHGLSSAKEWSLTTMYRLAAAGFDVSVFDLYLHGERPEAAMQEQRLSEDYVGAVMQIIMESVGDIPSICAELNINYARAGVLGISLGGLIAHALALQQPHCAAMVVAISTPDWTRVDHDHTVDPSSPEAMLLKEVNPFNHPESYLPMPLCMLNGALDEIILPVGSADMYKRLAPLYRERGIGDSLQLVIDPNIGHDYNDGLQEITVEWFKRHLS